MQCYTAQKERRTDEESEMQEREGEMHEKTAKIYRDQPTLLLPAPGERKHAHGPVSCRSPSCTAIQASHWLQDWPRAASPPQTLGLALSSERSAVLGKRQSAAGCSNGMAWRAVAWHFAHLASVCR